MRTLDARKAFILHAVVRDHVATAEPVGSEAVVERYQLRLSAATVRNEMAEMSEMGYLRQPHVSAGRIPSDLGYRYYVDYLMKPLPVDRVFPRRHTRLFSPSNPETGEVEHLLQATCRLLAERTRYTSVATAPETEVVSIRQILLSQPVAAKVLLVVLVASSGQVEHRLIPVSEQVGEREIVVMDRLLQQHYVGRAVRSPLSGESPTLPADAPVAESVWGAVLQAVKDCIEALSEQEVFMEGIQHILEQPEFQQIERLQPIISLMERRYVLMRLLQPAAASEGVQVIIGEENPLREIRHLSFVASSYRIGDRVAGAISVFGPTRMQYEVALTAVRYIASALSRVLTQISANS